MDMEQEISIEEIMQKIKDEVSRRKSLTGAETAETDFNQSGGGVQITSGNELSYMNSGNFADASGNKKINFPKQRIELLINDTRYKSQIRSKIPNALNRFPVNKSKLLQKIILKFYELLFREQRTVNNGILDALQEFVSAQSETEESVNGLTTRASELDGKIDGGIGTLRSELAGLAGKFNDAEQDIFRQIKDHKLNIVDMQRRLMLLLEEARKRLPSDEPFSVQQIENMLKEEDHIFDAMYATFEDRFRGTREDIKNRQQVYLPYIKGASDKTDGAQIIDVGCGRGEWLELLKENGFDAKGIDLNDIMINICRDLNLDAVSSDAIEYLRSLSASSLCAVTGFHIIEHLPFKTLIALFDESFRVLKSGGVVIFETPNPENLSVGACTFYTDPSHIKPLVPLTMQFIAEYRGFSKVEIKRLHKCSDYYNVVEENKFVTENFFNEMDYALIGFKK
jgi:O-antigen chain-terminating methyltransferase